MSFLFSQSINSFIFGSSERLDLVYSINSFCTCLFRPVKIFFTYSVNGVAGNMGPALIDKQIMLI